MKKIATLLLILTLAVGATMALTSCGDSGNENGEVYVYNYGDYINPEVKDLFEEETGIKVIYDTYDTNEEMYPVVKTGSASYDVICPSDYMVEKMIAEDLLEEINFDNVPNIKNLDQKYMNMAKEYDPENKYSVPYTWGTAGIMYNTDVIPKGSISSWNDLWNKKYSGEIVMQDSLRDTMMVALKGKGYSLNSTNEKELAEATKYLIEQKPLVYKYANDAARDLLIGESAALGVVWNGEVIYSKELNDKLDFVVPKEGSQVFIDAWAIPKGAKNKENAEKWIDFLCKPEIAFKNFEYLTYSTPNKGAIEMMDEKYKNDQALFPSEEIIKNCEVLKNIGPEGDDLYSKYWKKFKAL